MNIMKNMCEIEKNGFVTYKLEAQSKVDVEMDVDEENLKASENISSLREVEWDEGEDEAYKELLLFEKVIAVKVRDELNEVSKNLKKRSLEATKGKMGKLGVWLKEKGMEVEKMAERDINHKEKFENDSEFKEMLTDMSNVVSAIELSNNKEKTRQILEDNLKNMIDGSNIVVISKCTEIWSLFDELQEEMKSTFKSVI